LKCPNCGSIRAKYKHRKGKKDVRKNFKAECRKCGWKGIIK